MRLVWACLAVTLASGASGSDFGAALATAYKHLKPKLIQPTDLPQPPESPNPREASGFPPPTGKRALPAPKDGPLDPNQLLLRSATSFSRKGNRVTGSGDVRFSYQGYDVTADKVDGNMETQIFLLSGRVLLVGTEQVVRGEEVVVNFKDNSYRFLEGSAQIGPTHSSGNLIGDLYVKGQEGAGKEEELTFENSSFTTCDLDHPHYSLDSRRAHIRPARRALLRDVRVKIFGSTLLRIPYLVIPLRRYSDRYLPEVGQSRDEGYYVKTKIFTPLPGDSYITNHVDYYTKLKFGLGQDFNYYAKDMEGVFRYYGLTGGPKTILSSINHRQRVFGGLFTMDGNYQKDNYLTSPGTTQASTRAQFLLPQDRNSTRVSYFRSLNKSQSFQFDQENIGLSDQRSWSSTLTSQIDLTLVSATTSSPPSGTVKRSEFDMALRATNEFRSFTGELEYIRNIPIDSPEEFFSGSDRTPFLTLRSSSVKLFGPRFGQALPMRMLFSFGELQESQTVGRIRRTYLDLDFTKQIAMGSRSNINFGSRYRQGLYSDKTAGYALNFNFDYRYMLGADTSFNFRYAYLRPYGFTPLQLDRVGNSHFMNTDISYRPIRSLILSAQTGFDVLQLDLRQTPWQTVGFTTTWTPNNRFQLRGYTNYDTFQHTWSNARLDMGWYTSKGLLSIGTRYDGQRHTFASINLTADSLVWKKLRTSAILAYNGYTKRFDSRQLSFTYDLHCTELIFQIIDNAVGFRSGVQYGIYLRLKSLPFATPFGIGTRGQAVGSSLGF